jgi:hypothetical protein
MTPKLSENMSYYVLECFEPFDWEDSAIFDRSPKLPGVDSWRTGRRFETAIPEPIEFSLLPTHNDQLLEFYNVDALVMTQRLATALLEAGVDSLDIYKAVIRHPGTGSEVIDYVAANLIGLVSAVDLAQSKVTGGTSGGLLDVDFEGVRIDPARAGDHLMFRLAENTSAVVVHERVKHYLVSRGFDMLEFVPP